MLSNNGKTASSTDGSTWTEISSSQPLSSIYSGSWCRGLTYGKGKWVATNSGNTKVAISTDGVNWTGYDAQTSSDTWLPCVFANGIFMTGGYNQTYTSSDGINWTQVSSVNCPHEGLGYLNGAWYGDDLNYHFYKSTDNGATWSQPYGCLNALPGHGGYYSGFETVGEYMYAVGYSSSPCYVVRTKDGVNWEEFTEINLGTATRRNITYYNGKLFVYSTGSNYVYIGTFAGDVAIQPYYKMDHRLR